MRVEGTVRRQEKLPNGVLTLVHTPYRSTLRVIPHDKSQPQFVKEYDYAEAAIAQRDFDTLLAVFGVKEGVAA